MDLELNNVEMSLLLSRSKHPMLLQSRNVVKMMWYLIEEVKEIEEQTREM
jgi:hypothetical protein